MEESEELSVSCIFGSNLKRLMKEAGFVSHTLAAELDIDVHTVWRWRKGQNLPPLIRIVDLAAVLKITPNSLFQGLFEDTHEKAIADFYVQYLSQNKDLKNYTERLIARLSLNLKDKGVGPRIKMQRIHMGLSTQQIADVLETDADSARIRDYEYNASYPQPKNFIQICNCLHTTPDFLLWDMMIHKPSMNPNLYCLLPSTIELFTETLKEMP